MSKVIFKTRPNGTLDMEVDFVEIELGEVKDGVLSISDVNILIKLSKSYGVGDKGFKSIHIKSGEIE